MGGDVTIMLTSFGGFPGARVNPTMAVAALAWRDAAPRLRRLGLRLVLANLPVVYGAVAGRLAHLYERHQPRAVLHLGLAGRRTAITPETRAVNRLSLLHVDASGRRAGHPAIDANGPHSLRATLPGARLLRAVRAGGAAAHLSRDAGDYVCNQVLYLSLRRAARQGALVGFVHIPRPRGNHPPRRQGVTARPTLREMARAVTACLLYVARLLRRQGRLPPGGARL